MGLSAGAGCGKTFVLIERFLAELDPSRTGDGKPVGLPAVVAITFTDKAAREMKTRVREGVRRRLHDPARRAERPHWRDVLRRLDTARIGTIHGFCSELLRSHAADAGLDPRFGVLEEADEADLKSAALDAALRDALAEDPDDAGDAADGERIAARTLLTRYGLNRLREITASLAWFSDLSGDFDVRGCVARRAAAWETHVRRLAADLAGSPTVREAVELLETHPAENPKHAEARRVAAGVLRSLGGDGDLALALEQVAELCKPAAVGNKRTWPENVDMTKLLADVRGAAQTVADALDLDPAAWDEPARLGLAFLPLARSAAANYRRAKDAAAMLDNDDLLARGRALLELDAVRERESARVRLLMVDEFQDTDPVQAAVVRAVAGLGEPGASSARRPRQAVPRGRRQAEHLPLPRGEPGGVRADAAAPPAGGPVAADGELPQPAGDPAVRQRRVPPGDGGTTTSRWPRRRRTSSRRRPRRAWSSCCRSTPTRRRRRRTGGRWRRSGSPRGCGRCSTRRSRASAATRGTTRRCGRRRRGTCACCSVRWGRCGCTRRRCGAPASNIT